MINRLKLDELLKKYSQNVYYQPTVNTKMKYPAIIYERSSINNKIADNKVYTLNESFSVAVVSKNPDEPIVYELANLNPFKHNRRYVSDGLYHDIFYIYT